MKIKIKFHTSYLDYEATGIYSVTDEEAEKYVGALKVADVYVEKPAVEPMTEEKITELVAAQLKEVKDGQAEVVKKIGEIQVKDAAQDDPMAGYDQVYKFFKDVHAAGKEGGNASEALKRSQAILQKTNMVETDPHQGGYLVPTQVAGMLAPIDLETEIASPRAAHIAMQNNTVQIPALVDATHDGSFYGGVVIYRPGEGEQKDQSKPNFRQIQLTLHKMAVLIGVSDELIEDSPISIPGILNNVVPQAIAFQKDDDFINGNGVNMALGAFNAGNAALIAQAQVVGQGPGTIIFENIIQMWSRFKMINPTTSMWLCNHDCFPQLASMAMAVGTGGAPVWLPANGVAGAPFGTLMGLPLVLTEKMQTIGTQGDIGLVDWSQYYVGDKGGIKVAQSMHLWFDYDLQAFRFVLRSDGQPSWATPLTPHISATTLSPYVVLATRV